MHTVLFYSQPLVEPVSLDEEFPRQAVPAAQTVAAVVCPCVSDGRVEAHHLVYEMAEELRLVGYLGKQGADLGAQDRQEGGDECRHGINVDRVQSEVGAAEVLE